MFDLQGEILEINIEDIYFITSLSRCGVAMSLAGFGHGGGALSVQDYVDTYCLLSTQKSSTQILITQVTSFPLKCIVSTINRVDGTSALNLATWNHMNLAVECLQSVVFYWCTR